MWTEARAIEAIKALEIPHQIRTRDNRLNLHIYMGSIGYLYSVYKITFEAVDEIFQRGDAEKESELLQRLLTVVTSNMELAKLKDMKLQESLSDILSAVKWCTMQFTVTGIKKCLVLRYPLELVAIEFDSLVEKAVMLVRLADRYLQVESWHYAEMSYRSAARILFKVTTPPYLDAINKLARLAPLGLSHSLFAQEKWVDSAHFALIAVLYFPKLPYLKLHPRSLFGGECNALRLRNELSQRIEELTEAGNKASTEVEPPNQCCPTHNKPQKEIWICSQVDVDDNDILSEVDMLSFLLAFHYHFLGEFDKAGPIFSSLADLIPQTAGFLSYYAKAPVQVDAIELQRDSLVQVDPLSLDEAKLRKLAVRMMDSKDGVECCDRKYRLRSYTKCFIASEAITWITENMNVLGGRNGAIGILRQMQKHKWLYHVSLEHAIKDEFLFFHWCDPRLLSPIRKQGYLQKKGSLYIWYRRWVQLHSEAIAVFESPDCPRPLSVHSLDPSKPDIKFGIAVEGGTTVLKFLDGKETVIFTSSGKDGLEINEWFKAMFTNNSDA